MPTTPPRGPLLDVAGAATYMGTTTRHIRRLISERRIGYVHVGGKVRFFARDIDDYLHAQIVGPITAELIERIGRHR